MTKSLRLASALGLALLASCTKPNPAACDGEYCPTKALPFCDTDGALEGEPGTCIPVACTPGDFVACRGDQAITCNTTGTNYDLGRCDRGCDPTSGCITQVVACTPGEVTCGDRVVQTCNADGTFSTEACDVSCIAGPTPHCAYLEPKYLPDICDVPAAEAHLDLGAIDTTTDQLCNGGIVAQTDGPQICVLRYKSIALAESATSKVIGNRALALVADDDIDLAGTFDISADAGVNGAGGGTRKSGGAPADKIGAGGAGFVTSGGNGGSRSADGGALNGGAAFDPVTAGAVVGGSQHIVGLAVNNAPRAGGAGGAALVVSCHGVVTVAGLIDAGGGGGAGGRPLNASSSNGGAGGGSGGYVVLQGLNVVVTGRVYANGGNGGHGNTTSRGIGAAGGDAQRAASAPPVAVVLQDEGAGGAGGFEGIGPQDGHRPDPSVITSGTPSLGSAGGGGGSVGAFQVYTPSGVMPPLTPADASPRLRPALHTPVR